MRESIFARKAAASFLGKRLGQKIAFPVKNLTIAGTADEILNGIDMVANDPDMNRSLTAPTLRIRVLQIGGE